jgi:signal transduction histidine kinase
MSGAATTPTFRRRGPRRSYRLKVPLALSAVALASGVAVALTTYLLVYRYVEANAISQTQRLTLTLARSLAPTVLANDVWQAFQTLRASSPGPVEGERPMVQVIVLDAQGTVFVALNPREYPLGLSATRLPPRLASAATRLAQESRPEAVVVDEDPESNRLVVAAPLLGEDQAPLGVVIVEEETGISRAQARSVALRLALLGSVAIAIVVGAGWAIGRRMTAPLDTLRRSMRVAPSQDVRPVVADVSRLNDEVGDLGRAFLVMMDELDSMRRLERDMLNAERMASIGRLTAGIAHEVNNPLGGMLNAIANRRMRGGLDEATERTLGLLERGLQQVHSTVGALLNEARLEAHPLGEDDLRDLHLLVQPEAARVRCTLDWRVGAPVGGSLPSVPVRQVALNLALNAVAAGSGGGRVRVASAEEQGEWSLRVSNTGTALDAAALDVLLKGKPTRPDERAGLGLWVTAGILQSLGGRLELAVPADGKGGFATTLTAIFPFDSTSARR